MHRTLMTVAAMVVALAPMVAHADPVRYTLQGSFTGSLGLLSFTSVSGTLTFQGDDSGTRSLGAGYYDNKLGTSSITLAGIGTATFLSPTFGVESQFEGASFFDLQSGFGVGIYDPTLGFYSLAAPFSDTGYLQRSFATAFGTQAFTSLGELSLDGDDGTPATFSASKMGPTASTPEPGSFLLLLTGILGLAGVMTRRGSLSGEV